LQPFDEEVLERAHRRSPPLEVDVNDIATLRQRDCVQAEAPALANGHQLECIDCAEVVTAGTHEAPLPERDALTDETCPSPGL
jgi:hypothetical protein